MSTGFPLGSITSVAVVTRPPSEPANSHKPPIPRLVEQITLADKPSTLKVSRSSAEVAAKPMVVLHTSKLKIVPTNPTRFHMTPSSPCLRTGEAICTLYSCAVRTKAGFQAPVVASH